MKEGVWIVSLIVAVAIIGVSSEFGVADALYDSPNCIETDKQSYTIGDDVLVSVGLKNVSGTELAIFSGNNVSKYLEVQGNLSFQTKKAGNYTAQLINSTNDTIICAANFTVNKKTSSFSVYTDKEKYAFGETVLIYIDPVNENYRIVVSVENKSYNFLGKPAIPLEFKPKLEGSYLVSVTDRLNITETASFTVGGEIEKPKMNASLTTDKKQYEIGDLVEVLLEIPDDGNYSLLILSEKSSYQYLGLIESPIMLTVSEDGNYTILLNKEEETVATSSFVVGKLAEPEPVEEEEEIEHVFTLSEDVSFDFDFSEDVEGTKNILEKLFGMSPIDEVRAYILGQKENDNFQLMIDHIGTDSFSVLVKSNPRIEPDIYTLYVEVKADDEIFSKTQDFKWDAVVDVINETEEINETIEEINISNYLDYSFALEEPVLIEVDFTGKIEGERDIFGQALKQSVVEQITAYVEGEEENENFNLTIESVEYDKFLVRINANENIEADVYNLVTLAAAGEQIATDETLFNWGLSAAEIVEKVFARNITAPVIPTNVTINVTEPVNVTLPANVTINETLPVNVTLNETLPVNVTLNITNETKTSVFLNIKDHRKQKLHSMVRFYRDDVLVKEIHDEMPKDLHEMGIVSLPKPEEVPIGTYDIEIIPEDVSIKRINFRELNFSGNIELGLSDVNEATVDIESKNIVNAYSVDPTALSFTNATVSVVAQGTELYKCKDWNFEQQICTGEWKKVMDITPGQEYDFVLTAEDPGYAETGVATVNTKKSIYRPNEAAEIVMVVLDTGGHLVDGAAVDLEITMPDGQKRQYSTSLGSIVETDRGIYEATFSETALEGNYNLFVKAVGDNVDNAMQSYFSVKSYYEFDILRTTPVTMDPGKGPFDSSIQIVSFTNSSVFDFSEVLPASFTISDLGGASVSEVDEKKILTWSNLENNSIVSYSAQPPQVTPELYELGPSYVTYNSQTFTEARPWFLAIDPPFEGGFMIFFEASEATPDGWTCVSCTSGDPFYNTYIRGNDTYGNTGGTMHHTHTMSMTDMQAPATVIRNAGGQNKGGPTHTHAMHSPSVSTTMNTPQSRALKVIVYDNGIPDTVPAGAIAIFNTSTLPEGWTRYSDQDDYFLFGNGSAATFGSNNEAHSFSASFSATTSYAACSWWGNQCSNPNHLHTVSGTTSIEDRRPPYLGVVLAEADIETIIPGAPNGMIAMFNVTPSSTTWDVLSDEDEDFSGRFLYGTDSYGDMGGSDYHPHDDTDHTTSSGTLLNPGCLAAGSRSVAARPHTHQVTMHFTTEEAKYLPPFIDVIFAAAIDAGPPLVTLEDPAEGYWNGTYDPAIVDFNCSVLDTNATNISLYLTDNETENFALNGTCLIPPEQRSGSCNWTRSLSNGNYTWNCLAYDHLGNSSWATNRTDLIINHTFPPPVVSKFECELAGEGWVDCEDMLYSDTLLAVRVECTGGDYMHNISNMSFEFFNVPDNKYYINTNATHNDTNWWVYDISDAVINDSGEYWLNVTCWDTTSKASFNSSNWTIAWGNLSSALVDASDIPGNVSVGQIFSFSSQVNCTGGECGYINASLDPINWWNTSWSRRKDINVTSVASSDLENFPVFLNISLEPRMQTDFGDLRFLNASCNNGGDELYYELDNYTSSYAYLWVNFPHMSPGEITTICMYYGNPTEASGQNRTAVWDPNYVMVQHLDDAGAGDSYINDSTAYDKDGVKKGSGSPAQVNSLLGHGQNFDGTDFINISDSTEFDVTEEVTLEAWVKGDAFKETYNADEMFVIRPIDDYDINIPVVIGETKHALAVDEETKDNAVTHLRQNDGGLTWLYDLYHPNFNTTDYPGGSIAEVHMRGVIVSGIGATNGGRPVFYDNEMHYGTAWWITTGWGGGDDEHTQDITTFRDSWAWNDLRDYYYGVDLKPTFLNVIYCTQLFLNMTYNVSSTIVGKGEGFYQLGISNNNQTWGYVNNNAAYGDAYDIYGDKWHHLVMTYNSTHERLYVDGVLATEINVGESIATNDNNLTLGDYFDGIIDEVRVSNVSRSSDWVNQSYTLVANQSLYVSFSPERSKGIIPEDSGEPFFTTDQNPRDYTGSPCLGNMQNGSSCTQSWDVTVTGNPGTTWDFFVIYESMNYTPYGIFNNSPMIMLTIYKPEGPTINDVQCELNDAWVDCTTMKYWDNLSAVRVNCVSEDIFNIVSNVSFNLSNSPDNFSYFNANATSNESVWWIYDNSNLTINDSGYFSLNVTCWDSYSLSDNYYFNWSIPWGNLTSAVILPTKNLNVSQGELFEFISEINCTGGECGYIQATLDPLNWWNTSWSRRKNINITSVVSSTLTNFPVFLNISIEPIMQHDLQDLRFLDEPCNNGGDEMDYEIGNYTTEHGEVWIRIPTLPANENVSICMYYANPNEPSGENVEAVWDFTYKMVQHLDDGPTNISIDDSTSYFKDGLKKDIGEPAQIAGLMGAGQSFDGLDDHINISDSSFIDFDKQVTLEAWVKGDSYKGTYNADEKYVIRPLDDYVTNIPAETPGGSKHALVLDEEICDEGTTYITQNDGDLTWLYDLYYPNLTSSDYPGGSVANVTMHAVVAAFLGPTSGARPVFYDGSMHYGTAWSIPWTWVASGYKTQDITSFRDLWTWNDLKDYYYGIDLKPTFLNPVYSSQIFLNITYNVSSTLVGKGESAYHLGIGAGNYTWGYINNRTVYGKAPGLYDGASWHHVVMTYNETHERMYIDGVMTGEKFVNMSIVTNNENLTIGDFVDGVIDEVRVSNESRSADWINQSYQLVANQARYVTFSPELSKGVIPPGAGVPFFTTNGNPRNYSETSCLGDMDGGDNCTVSWTVNATGDVDSFWDFFAIYESTNYSSYVGTNITDDRTIGIYFILNISVLNGTKGVYYNSSIDIYDGAGLLSAKTLSDTEDSLEIFVGKSGPYNITINAPMQGENLTAKIFDARIPEKVSFLTQFVQNYSGFLQFLPTEYRMDTVTPIFTLNDSFDYASGYLKIPKKDIDVSRICHCENWDFTTVNCTEWTCVNPASSMPNYGEDGDSFWFDVEEFSGYAGAIYIGLEIWDSTDPKGGSYDLDPGDNAFFYTNLSEYNGTPISDATCLFDMTDGVPAYMDYNTTSKLYETNQTAGGSGYQSWNVTCIPPGYTAIWATDFIFLQPTWYSSIGDIMADGWARHNQLDENNWNPTQHDDDIYVGENSDDEYLSIVGFNLTAVPQNINVTYSVIVLRRQELQGTPGEIHVFVLNGTACDWFDNSSTADYDDVEACQTRLQTAIPYEDYNENDEVVVVDVVDNDLTFENELDDEITFKFVDISFENDNRVSWDTSVADGADSGATYDPPLLTLEYQVPPHFYYWTIKNPDNEVIEDGYNATRAEKLLLETRWSENLSSAKFEHNGNGSFFNYTDTDIGIDYVNYTLNLSLGNEFKVGIVNVTALHVQDVYNLFSNTTPPTYFYVYGYAVIPERLLVPSVIHKYTNTTFSCRVTDRHSNFAIPNYNVTFYIDDTYLGHNYSNSDGWAIWHYDDTTDTPGEPTQYTFTCNLTEDLPNYYFQSSEYEKTEVLDVYPTTFDIDPPLINEVSNNPPQIIVGRSTFFTANVTDDSGIGSVILNITNPNGTNYSYPMEYSSGDLYTHNFTETTVNGSYSYYVWADDAVSGVSNQTEVDTFQASFASMVMSVQTIKDSYKQEENVELFPYSYHFSDDLESGSQSVVVIPAHNLSLFAEDFESGNLNQWKTLEDVSVGGAYARTGSFGARLYNNWWVAFVSWMENTTLTTDYSDIWFKYSRNLVSCEDNDMLYIEWYDGADWNSVEELYASGGGWSDEEVLLPDAAENLDDFRVRFRLQSDTGFDWWADYAYVDDINVTATIPVQKDSDPINYSTTGSNFTKVADVEIKVETTLYNATGSVGLGAAYPDIVVSIYDGVEFGSQTNCELKSAYGTDGNFLHNCSIKISNKTIMQAWNNSNNRKIQLRAIDLEEDDQIDWSGVYIQVNTPSKASNYNPYLEMTNTLRIQIINSTHDVVSTFYNQEKTIDSNDTLNLSTLNAIWNTGSLPLGTYKVYSDIWDGAGPVQNVDESHVNDSYNFEIDYLRLAVESPINNSVVDATNFWANVSLNYVSYPSGGWCGYSLDGGANVTMQNDSSVHFYGFTSNTSVFNHTLMFFCNDTDNDISNISTSFYATDQSGPLVYLMEPFEGEDGLPTTITFKYNVTDIVSNITNCSIYIDNSFEDSDNVIEEETEQNFTVGGFSLGVHDWRVDCYDNSTDENFGQSATQDFMVGADDIAPEIFLGDPQNNTESTNNDVVFFFGVYDELSAIDNCTLIVNGKINQTKNGSDIVESYNNDDNNITFYDMPIGQYNWTLNCTDGSSNKNVGESETRNISIIEDTDYPQINLMFPDFSAQFTSGNINFRYNVSDASSGIANCTLLINDTIKGFHTNPAEGATNTFSVTGLTDGYQIWNVTCIDDSFQVNQNISETRNFTVVVLSDLTITVESEQVFYERGTKYNKSINISTKVLDELTAPVNVSVTTDIIQGNTTLRWWNSSWTQRKPIYLNETFGTTRTDRSIEVNVTGLAGNVTTCLDEIRVVENSSMDLTEIPLYVSAGDDSTFCTIKFDGTVTGSAVHENNYFAYYDNPTASDPSYNYVPNTTGFYLATAGVLTGTYDDSNGVYTDTFVEDDNNWDVGDNNWWSTVHAYMELTYDITAIEISEDEINDLTFNLTYCHSGEGDDPIECDGGQPIEGSSQGSQDVEVYNYDLTQWDDIGNLRTNDNENAVTDSWSVTSDWSQYIDDSTDQIRVRYEMYYTNNIAQQSYLALDYAPMTVNFKAVITADKIGVTYALLNSSKNDTADDGLFQFDTSSTGPDKDSYSAISRIVSDSYNDGLAYTFFRLEPDATGPVVNLMLPEDENISQVNNMTFFYNTSDTASYVSNCTLVINLTYNQTDYDITEDTVLNFSLTDLENTNYGWNVRCLDDYPIPNVGTATERSFMIALDEDPPTIDLVTPVDGYNETDGNLTFYFELWDEYATTADCDFYINGVLNDSRTGLYTNASTYDFNLSFIDEGEYEWFINCTDDSIAENSNVSNTWNFTVIYDFGLPSFELIGPIDYYQSTTGNVSFTFNVSDAISEIANCSLLINGTMNQTNTSVDKNHMQNFTVTGFDLGEYSWNVTCTDNSDYHWSNTSESRIFIVATDIGAPNVSLMYPPNDGQLVNPNVLFWYNATDFASELNNCSLIINGTINQTNTTYVPENTALNFTVDDMEDGDYTWQVNCSDNSDNGNTGGSEIWNLTIGQDETPPEIYLQFPPDDYYADTDGNVTFRFYVDDLATDIANCTVILDGVLNTTNTSFIEEGVSGQEIFVPGVSNGTHTWSMNCTDTAFPPNTGNSSTWTFEVHIDQDLPAVNLINPSNNTVETDGVRMFEYVVSDVISDIANCSLIFDDVIQQTNTTITEGETQNFTVTGMTNGVYEWKVNCTDGSDYENINSSETWVLNVSLDSNPPAIYLMTPENNSVDTDGNVIFNYNVTDIISNITNCSLLFDGAIQKTNFTVDKDVVQNFSVTGLSAGTYNWSVRCTDDADSFNVNTSEVRNLTVMLVDQPPAITLYVPENNSQDFDGGVNFTFSVISSLDIANCSLIINGTINETTYSPPLGEQVSFEILDIYTGHYDWNVNCTDTSEVPLQNSSEIRFLVIGPDTEGPVIDLESPDDEHLSTSPGVVFSYSVNDVGGEVDNCSFIINGTINQTNTTITEGITQVFLVTGFDNGGYLWEVNCTDNASTPNLASSDSRVLYVGSDVTPPQINLMLPVNNTRSLSQDMQFYFNTTDVTSNVSNCTLMLNDVANQTLHDIPESVQLLFVVPHLDEGPYNWSIECTDDAEEPNTGSSYIFNLSVRLPDRMLLNVSTGNLSYQQGSLIDMTLNATTVSELPLNATVSLDVVRGNITVPWWNGSWRYRIPVTVNSTDAERTNKIVEQAVNFTTILGIDLGAGGTTFDSNSVRVIEWSDNRTIEVASQFNPSESFDATANAYGDVVWLLNSTTAADTTRDYYIYFETTASSKSAAGYAEPTYNLIGSAKSVELDGSSTSASRMFVSFENESFTLSFNEGNAFNNFDYVSYAGSGSIWNITINDSTLTNPDSAIAPFIVRADDYMFANSTTKVTTGPVMTRINMPGNITTVADSRADINYTIWFVDSEIRVMADLYAYFGSAESAPSVKYMNEWFAYMLSNNSDWTNYINNAQSAVQNRTHQYNNKVPAGANNVYSSSWYNEYNEMGSVSVYAEVFKKNGAEQSKGVIIYNDGYDTPPESDSVGFDFDETTISAGTSYNLRVWMIFSPNNSSQKITDIISEVSVPLNVTLGSVQELMNKSSGVTDENGTFYANWSSANQESGWYSAIGIANKFEYYNGVDYSFFNVLPDLIPPDVALGPPEGWLKTEDITFYYNVSESNSLSNCSLIIDGKVNDTDLSPVNNGENTFTVNSFSEGTYNWTVNCIDQSSNIGNATDKTFYVDLTKPSTELRSPANEVIINYTTVDFNFTAFDNIDTNITCNLTINSIDNVTYIDSFNDTSVNVTVSDMAQGRYSWNVTCWDDAYNTNISDTWSFIIDYSPPTVTLNTPSNNSWDGDGNVLFVYTPFDYSGVDNCSLIIDGVINQTNITIDGGEQNNFSVTGIDEGIINWTVNCTDIGGFTGTTAPYTLNVDKTVPYVNISAPADGNVSDRSTLEFIFNATDNMATSLSCNITINQSINNTSPISVTGGIEEPYEISGFNDGLFSWNVTCWDTANNSNVSETKQFTVAEIPVVTLGNPPDNYWTKTRDQTFYFTPTDNSGSLSNCTLIFNDGLNVSSSSITEGQENSIVSPQLADGLYNWSINCTDGAGLTGASPNKKSIFIDNKEPFIEIHNPWQGQNFSVDDVVFNFTATDNLAPNLTCNLTLNNFINETNFIVPNGSSYNLTIDNLDLGNHSWNVTCWDSLNNTNISETIEFIVNAPDLVPYDISFNTSYPTEDSNVSINVTVTNIGGLIAESVIVRFFDGNPATGGTQIKEDRIIETIGVGASESANVTWKPSIGSHVIFVAVDPDGDILELNDSNNNASTNISVSSWQTVFGNITGDLVIIEATSNKTVFSWNETTLSGSVLVTDADSSVTWTNLTAIGITVSGSRSMDDFEEIDTAMSTTVNSDSVNFTYTSNSVPRNMTSFDVFLTTINNVSVANSTNTSEFVTGILWDNSDTAGTEYDGDEDLVFITDIHNAVGTYGIYDFEMRIPARLREYVAPNNYNYVTFYLELK
ncbi:MAG: DUF2341 domain-containing protein [bacterium]|nr:DUF2341 domain-containing protein [bacterium]